MTAPSPAPYRNEIDALRERKEALEREIARLRQHTSELDELRSREQELARELASITATIGATGKRALPLLDQVRVASPCNVSWGEMLGNDQVRFCGNCEKNVYNLSAMPRDEAEQLLQDHVTGEVCVRFYKRADGTMMTSDCPVGATRKRRKKIALAVAGAGAMALAATSMLRSHRCGVGTVVQGEVAVMGSYAAPSPPPPAPPEEKPTETLGKVAAPQLGRLAPANPAPVPGHHPRPQR